MPFKTTERVRRMLKNLIRQAYTQNYKIQKVKSIVTKSYFDLYLDVFKSNETNITRFYNVYYNDNLINENLNEKELISYLKNNIDFDYSKWLASCGYSTNEDLQSAFEDSSLTCKKIYQTMKLLNDQGLKSLPIEKRLGFLMVSGYKIVDADILNIIDPDWKLLFEN